MYLHFPIILDGATGTELKKRGYDGKISSEEWVLANPSAIKDIQNGYIQAGSDIIYSPTFGANRRKLVLRGLADKTAAFNAELAGISLDLAKGRAFVAGDIAPTGKFMPPAGNATFEELYNVYYEQAAALEAAGVDLFIIETMMSLADARAAVLAVKAVSGKPVFVTFTCDERGKTVTGTDAATALTVMQSMGADAFGLNCSAGPEEMLKQLQRISGLAKIPLIAKPNAGLPKVVDGETVYDCTPEEFVSFVPDMLRCGVKIFGGCCGTDASHIAALKKALALADETPECEQDSAVYCTNEKNIFNVDELNTDGDVIDCDNELSSRLPKPNAAPDVLFLAFQDEASLAAYGKAAARLQRINRPVCLVCDDAVLLEKVLCEYQGRALYKGSLSDEVLAPLVKKYSLIRIS